MKLTRLRSYIKKALSHKVVHKRVIFESEGFYDNGFALFQYTTKNRKDIDAYFFLSSQLALFHWSNLKKPKKVFRIHSGNRFHRRLARLHMFCVLSQFETFFSTYAIYDMPPTTKIVFLSHGFALKKTQPYVNGIYSSGCDIVYPSQALRHQFETQYKYANNAIVICGQARSDLCRFKKDSANAFNNLIHKEPKEKVVLSATSFRRDKDGFLNPSIIFPDYVCLDQLETFLALKHIRLVVKLHHLLDNADISAFDRYPHIVCLKNKDIFSIGLELVSAIPYADAYISDYSGAASDAMLGDKPMAFFVKDLDEYAANSYEGFTYEDPLSMMPGNHIRSQSDLERFLLHVVEGKDVFREQRHRISMIMNGFVTPPYNSAKQLINLYYPEEKP